MDKTPPVPHLNISIQIELPQAAPVVPLPAVQRRLEKLPSPKTLQTLTKKSSVAKLNADIYPDKVEHNNTPEGKGMTPKPRPGYFH